MNRKLVAILAALLLVAACTVFILIKSAGSSNKPSDPDNNRNADSDGKVCEMFLSESNLYYTDHKVNLFKYDSSTGNGELIKKLKIAPGSQVFYDNGFLYYSDGNSVYKDTLGSTAPLELASGKNLWVDAVGGGKLFYHTAYKDESGDGYSEFDHHAVILETGEDTVLFKRSEDMWHFSAVSDNTIIADATVGGESGLYAIDTEKGSYRKLSDLRTVDGCIINEKYYFTTYDEKGLRALDLNSGSLQELALPGMETGSFFLDRITGIGDTIFAAVYYNNGNHLLRFDLKTGKSDLLTEVPGRVWKLYTNGSALYFYNTSSPADMEGNLVRFGLN